MFKYTLKKEVKEDKKLSTIVKHNVEVDFTLRDLEQVINYNTKAQLEVDAKIKVEKATLKNIEKNHPFVKDMSEQDLHTAKMYLESKQFVEEAEPKAKELKEAVEKDRNQLKDIMGQLPELKDIKLELVDEKTNK